MGDSMRRGAIVLAIYPFTDLSSAKRRPALVVSATERPERDCILAFITSRTDRAIETDLLLDSTDEGFAATGLRVTSLVRCGKLMTLDRTLLTGRLGQLDERLMNRVDVRLKQALGLSDN
ncbi:MAG: type II toxin-antitoxin system PemK/MazF family toxin [Chloroflexi bacterium]|nr:type II toxin-antitoxin system PemK/MazF family toxin [Chloroflexota bacterium]